MHRWGISFFIVLLLVGVSVAEAPVADFVADVQYGCGYLLVEFTSTSTGTAPLAYDWDVGGDFYDVPVFSRWLATGEYTITLTVTNADGEDTEIKTDFIIVTTAPTAAFSANTTTITAGDSVLFTDTSAPHVDSWSWSFGDGETSTLQNPEHRHDSPGVYTVTLEVDNIGGCGPDTETKTDYITVERRNGITVPMLIGFMIFTFAMVFYAFWDNGNRNFTHVIAAVIAVIMCGAIAYFLILGLVYDVTGGVSTVVSDVPFAYFFMFVGVMMLVYAALSALKFVAGVVEG